MKKKKSKMKRKEERAQIKENGKYTMHAKAKRGDKISSLLMEWKQNAWWTIGHGHQAVCWPSLSRAKTSRNIYI
jgi:hypothetical protein